MTPKTLSAFVLTVLFWLSAKADIPKDTIDIAVIPSGGTAETHVRSKASDWTLIWDYTDRNNFSCANVTTRYADNDYTNPYTTTFTVSHTVNGQSVNLMSRQYSHDLPGFSVNLKRSPGDIKLTIGDGTMIDAGDWAYTPCPADSRLILIHPARVAPEQFYTTMSASPLYKPLVISRHEIQQLIMTSKTSVSGIWQYLDRDIDTSHAILNTYYTLYIVPEKDTPNHLIFTDTDSPSQLIIKGRLTPSNFSNNYNLAWYTPEGTDVGTPYEANATIADNILTLRFPLLNSSFRLSR